MNKSLATIIATCVLTSTVASYSAVASDDESYTFVGFGLSHYENLNNLSLSETDIDLVPEFFFGVGKNYQLNNDWQLATELSLHYAKAHFSGVIEPESDDYLPESKHAFSGNYQALGLWASSRFKYVSMSDNVSPFVEIAIGAVQTNHSTLFGEEKNHGIAYKAVTGLEFAVANDVTFSLGFGVSNNDDNF